MITAPYLIQRGLINRPLTQFKGMRFSQTVDNDYMGSSEFEFGALPKSLRALQAGATTGLVLEIEKRILGGKKGKSPLFVLHFMQASEYEEYLQHLINLRENSEKVHTKERHEFGKDFKSFRGVVSTDFWWDIDNHVMWTFDEEYARHYLRDALFASWAYMDEQKAKG